MGSQPRTSMSTANINKQRFESLANKAKVKSEIMEIMPKGFEGAAPVGGWYASLALGSIFAVLMGLMIKYRPFLTTQFNTLIMPSVTSSVESSVATPTPTVADASAGVDASAAAGASAAVMG